MKTEQKLSFEDADLVIFIDNGMFFAKYKVEHVTLEIAKKLNNYFREVSQGETLLCVSDIRQIRKIDKAATVFLSSKEGCEFISAGAIIVNSVFQKIVGNIFIIVDKPAIPAKVFTDQHEAIKWLERFKSA